MIYLKKIYNSKWFNLLLFIIFLSIPFIVFSDLYLNNEIFLSGDGIGFFAIRIFTMNTIQNGEIPLWNPLLTNGIPWLGDFYGVLYPLQWLLKFLSLNTFIYVFYSIHVAAGAFFTYLYLKEVGIKKIVAIAVGLIYSCSIHIGGYRKTHMILIVAIVYLPIILYYIQKYINTSKYKYIIISSIIMALAFFSGSHIQDLLYIDIVVGIYFLVMLINKKIHILKTFKILFLWLLSYLGLISIQFIPALELFRVYSSSGATETSYNTFASYSIHPIKLIMMLFPRIFGESINMPMGGLYSSEMDIELFLGVLIPIFLLWFIAKYNKRNIYTNIYVCFAIISFMYASCAHIPFLGKLLYHLPLIGSFRVPSRILFVFIFFVYCIFAQSLNVIVNAIENNEIDIINNLNKLISKLLMFFLSVFLVLILFTIIDKFDTNNVMILVEKIVHIFNKPIIISFIICIVLKIIFILQNSFDRKLKGVIFTLLIVCITLTETMPYYSQASATKVDDLGKRTPVLDEISENINNGKLFLANQGIDGAYPSIISSNRNIAVDIPSINAYISINNPRLFKLLFRRSGVLHNPPFNYSGLYTGFEDAYYNLMLDNDILSMLGVKYIIDPQNLILDNGQIVESYEDNKIIYTNNELLLEYNSDELSIIGDNVSLKENTFYKIQLTLYSDNEQSLYLDFYGGENYDSAKQDFSFNISPGINEKELLIYSGESNLGNDIVWRIVGFPTADVMVNKIDIIEQKTEWQEGVYQHYIIDENNRIFENVNVKNVIYAAEKVGHIADIEEVYTNKDEITYDKESYVDNLDSFLCGETTVTNIVQKTNSARADVAATSKTFINFSQNYYPGWNVYIDGKKAENYLVNGLIQGTEVEAGNHIIEFKYEPYSVIIGSIISILTILFMLLFLQKERKRNSKQ